MVPGGKTEDPTWRNLGDASLWLTEEEEPTPSGSTTDELKLRDGARVAVVGGGPAGSLFSIFLLRSFELSGSDIELDIFEPRHFTYAGPAGCNHCGGVVSESLVQMLAAEGITLPTSTVKRGIESYMLHMDIGSVRIHTPVDEKRIAAVYRGNGPKESQLSEHVGFDKHLLDTAIAHGARHITRLVTEVDWTNDKPFLKSHNGPIGTYDVLVVATGVNSMAQKIIGEKGLGLSGPRSVKTFIGEFRLGRDRVAELLGDSMHVFLLSIPKLEFAALIPKEDFATICLLGDDIDDKLIDNFMNSPEVRARFGDAAVPSLACHCFPRINIRGARRPFGDRVVFIGDAGVTRLYKDGIGAAYRTAKAAALTISLHGFSRKDFARHYWPACRKIAVDNRIGVLLFQFRRVLQSRKSTRNAILRMVNREQASTGKRRMSGVLWDLFTGGASYADIMLRGLDPRLLGGLFYHLIASLIPARR